MKKTLILILNICLCIIVGTTSIYAWYTNYFGLKPTDNVDLSSNSTYFYSGNGTQGNPYIITEARHLYNLAWLQDLGFFDADDDADESTEAIDKFYFRLGDNIDMSELKKNGVQSPIPPIGIDNDSGNNNGHPFISNFDGTKLNNSNDAYTISNLIISTDFSNPDYIKPDASILSQHPETISDNIIQTNGVGTFGVIGEEIASGSTTAKTDNVQNFYLDNVSINSTTSKSNSTIQASVGIVAGIVHSNIKQIGVHYSSLHLNKAAPRAGKKLSEYAIIGEYDEDVADWGDKAGFGNSIDIAEVTDDLSSSTIQEIKSGEETFGYFAGALKKGDKTASYNNKDYTDSLRLNDNIGLDATSDYFTKTGVTISGQECSTLLVPKRSIYFIPKVSGTATMLFYCNSTGNNGFTFIESDRADKGKIIDDSKITIKEYACSPDTKQVYAKETINGVAGEIRTTVSEIEYDGTLALVSLPLQANKEYIICGTDTTTFNFKKADGSAADSSKARGGFFFYLDLGANGNISNPLYSIEKVDFVYKVESSGKLLDIMSDSYTSSYVSFRISNIKESNTAGEMYFRRNNDAGSDNQDAVLFYPKQANSTLDYVYYSSGNKGIATDNTCEQIEGDVITGSTGGLGGGGSGPVVTTKYSVTFNANGGSGTVPSVSDQSANATFTIPTTSLEKTGFDFGGWKSSADNVVYQAGVSYRMPSQNVTFTAQWIDTSSEAYTITFDANGGSGTVPTVEDRRENETFTIPTTELTNGDLAFDGWKSDADGKVYQVGASYTMPAKNVTFTAQWATLYAITFDDGNGTVTTIENKKANDIIKLSQAPERDGFIFTGWKSSVDDKLYPADSDYTLPEQDVTFTAQWATSAQSFTVTFDAGNGTTTQSVNAGKLATIPADPTRLGYEFIEWVDENGATYDFSQPITKDTTVTAKYIYIYDSLLARTDELIVNSEFENHSETDRLPEWSNTWGTKNIYYTTGKSSSSIVEPSVTTTYIQMNKGLAELVDKSDGASIQLLADFGSVTTGVVEGYFETTLNSWGNGWTFFQLYGKKGGSEVTEIFGIRVENNIFNYRTVSGGKVSEGTAQPPDGVSISAGDKNYKIYFKVVLPTDSTDKATITVLIGVENEEMIYFVKDLSITATEVAGFKLVSSDGGTKSQNVDNLVVVGPHTTAGEESYTVTFNSNGGSNVATITDVAKNEKIAQPTPNPTKGDATFAGWYKDPDFAETWNFETDTVTRNITLYAKWEEITAETKYTVTFEPNGGTGNIPTMEDQVAGATIILPSVSGLTNGNKNFAGWLCSKDNQTYQANASYTMPAENVIFRAQWSDGPTNYTITFMNGEAVVSTQSVESGGTITKPDDPTEENSAFAGWHTTNPETDNNAVLWDFETDTVTRNITLYAKWYDSETLTLPDVKTYTLTSVPQTDETITFVGSFDRKTDKGVNGLRPGGSVSSTRYIKIVLTSIGTISVGVKQYGAGKTSTVFINTSYGSTRVTTYGYIDLSDDANLNDDIDTTSGTLVATLQAGTYYLNWTAKDVALETITVTQQKETVVKYSGITGTPVDSYTAGSACELDLTGLTLETVGGNYSVELNNIKDKLNIVIENEAAFKAGTAGTYSVSITYGKHTKITYTVTVA